MAHFDIRIVASPKDETTEDELREILTTGLHIIDAHKILNFRIQKCKVQKPRIRPRKKERKEF